MRGRTRCTLAREYQPTAVSLDVFLPDMLGWTVLSQLKQNPSTRHIPVQIVTLDEDRQHGLARGAFSFMTKPTTRGLEVALGRIRNFASRGASVCLSSRTIRPSSSASASCSGTTTSTSSGWRPGRRDQTAARGHATVWYLTCACPTCRASTCWSACDDEALADVPVVVFTGREPLGGGRCAASHHGAFVVVKGVNRRSVCSMRRHCSCIA